MKTVFLFLLIISPQIYGKKSYGVKSNLEMRAMSVNSEQVNAKVFRYRMMFAKDIKIEQGLMFDVNLGFNLETGSNSSNIIQEYAPQRQLVLRNATMKWNPLQTITLETGAISQGRNRALLVGNIPFLGAKAKATFDVTQTASVSLVLQEAIPNNYFLAQRVGNINEEGTPRFSDQKIQLKSEDASHVFFAELSRFHMYGLSPSVAYQSQFLGNNISGGSQENSDFLYGFSGYYFSTSLEGHFNQDFGVTLRAQYLYNEKAPEGDNKGHLLFAGLKVFESHIYGVVFENQSDSSAAFYNSGRYGHNNRTGYSLGFASFTSLRSGKRTPFQYNIEYIHKEPINTNIFQSPEDKVVVRVRKNFTI